MELVYILGFLVFILAVSVHEAAHAYMADRLGDSTARLSGRLTLNPVSHIDPIGTILLPAVLLLSGSPFVFGWAKPVPYNPLNLTNPKLDSLKIAAAGPISNIVMAFACFVLLKFVPQDMVLFQVLTFGVTINLVLAIFNMIPIYPLDGSKVVAGLLPYELEYKFRQTEPYGFIILLVLVFTGVTSVVFSFFMPLFLLIFELFTFFV